MEIERSRLLFAAQRALLGAIGRDVLGICVRGEGQAITLTAYAETTLPLDERAALEEAASEIAADFPDVPSVEAVIVEAVQAPLTTVGIWVFLRYGCEID